MPNQSKGERALLGGGCFWCFEAIFQSLRGVKQVRSGYAGGKIAKPTYREVASSMSGHAEVVELIFDPQEISYSTIIQVFLDHHDPRIARQTGYGNYHQYRSIIIYQDEVQKSLALGEMKAWETKHKASIQTELVGDKAFYPAEERHQNYYQSDPKKPYCQRIINPKLSKLMESFPTYLKKSVLGLLLLLSLVLGPLGNSGYQVQAQNTPTQYQEPDVPYTETKKPEDTLSPLYKNLLSLGMIALGLLIVWLARNYTRREGIK